MPSSSKRRSPGWSRPDPPGVQLSAGIAGFGAAGCGVVGGTGNGGTGPDDGGTTVSECAAVFFAGTGSTTPGGTAMEAGSTSVPAADALTSPFTANVAGPPWISVTVVEIEPMPFAAPHPDPGVATQAQEAGMNAPESPLETVAPETSAGPALLTTIVPPSFAPGFTVATPGVIVTARSAITADVAAALAGVFAAVWAPRLAPRPAPGPPRPPPPRPPPPDH